MVKKMFSRKKLAAATTATAAIALVALLMAVLAAPAATTVAATPSVTSQNQASAKFRVPSMDEISKGRIISDYFDMKFADLDGGTLRNIINWTITPRNFGVNIYIRAAHIIEFNDTDENGVISFGDDILRDIGLVKDMTWNVIISDINITPDEVSVPLIGQSKEDDVLTMRLIIHFYKKDVNITGPNFSATVPALKSVKIDIIIEHYSWVDTSGNSKLALVLLLKCERTTAQEQYMFRLADGTMLSESDEASGIVPPYSQSESEIGFAVPHENQLRFTFRWFNYAVRSNGTEQSVEVKSGFNITKGWLILYLCVDYFGDDSLTFDPYFAVLTTPSVIPEETLWLFQYYVISAVSQQGNNVILVIGAAGVTLIAGIILTVYLRRK
ncbi:MAG: hypothetical protein ACTSWP_11065 [Candidatus Freyarchaeota archaeon]